MTLFIWLSLSFAHPGRTNKHGCHKQKSNYHCHDQLGKKLSLSEEETRHFEKLYSSPVVLKRYITELEEKYKKEPSEITKERLEEAKYKMKQYDKAALAVMFSLATTIIATAYTMNK